MIKEITFSNFRNLDGTYIFGKELNVVTGKNNSGKTNLLDGIRLAFSSLTNDYFKIKKVILRIVMTVRKSLLK